MHGVGWIPDPPDEKDHDALAIVGSGSAPARASARRLVKVVNQGRLGSCTAFSTGQAVRAAEIKQLVDAGMSLEKAQRVTEFFSFLFAYYLARAIHHATQVDSGSYIRFVFQILNKFGFPPESVWPYNDGSGGGFDRMPSSAAFRKAFDQRLAAENGGTAVVKYSRIFDTGYARVEAIKRAIAMDMLVVFGTRVSVDFVNDGTANEGNPIDPPIKLALAGGHAMAGAEYDEHGLGVPNSWGTDYGQDGWCKLSWDYIAWTETTDVWIVERAPIFSEAP